MGANRCSMHHEVSQGKSAHKATGMGSRKGVKHDRTGHVLSDRNQTLVIILEPDYAPGLLVLQSDEPAPAAGASAGRRDLE